MRYRQDKCSEVQTTEKKKKATVVPFSVEKSEERKRYPEDQTAIWPLKEKDELKNFERMQVLNTGRKFQEFDMQE